MPGTLEVRTTDFHTAGEPAMYASVPASSVDLAVTTEHDRDLIAVGREIHWALNDHDDPVGTGFVPR